MSKFQNLWAEAPLNKQVYYLALMIVAGMSIFSMLGAGLVSALYDVDLFSQTPLYERSSEELPQALLFLQCFTIVGTFLVPAGLYYYTIHSKAWPSLWTTPKKPIFWILAPLCFLALQPAWAYLLDWNAGWSLPDSLGGLKNWVEESALTQSFIKTQLIDLNNSPGFAWQILVIAVLPAIAEEFLFRGAIQGLFSRWFQAPWKAIAITALLFAAMHQQFFGIVPLFLAGLLLGFIRYWSGSLWPAILAHFINNLGSLITRHYQLDWLWETALHLSLGLLLAGGCLYFMIRQKSMA